MLAALSVSLSASVPLSVLLLMLVLMHVQMLMLMHVQMRQARACEVIYCSLVPRLLRLPAPVCLPCASPRSCACLNPCASRGNLVLPGALSGQ